MSDNNRMYIVLQKDFFSKKVNCVAMSDSFDIIKLYKKQRDMTNRKVLIVNMDHEDLEYTTRKTLEEQFSNYEIIPYEVPLTLDEEMELIERLCYYGYEFKSYIDQFKKCISKDILKFSDEEKARIDKLIQISYDLTTQDDGNDYSDENDDENEDDLKKYRFKQLIKKLGFE